MKVSPDCSGKPAAAEGSEDLERKAGRLMKIEKGDALQKEIEYKSMCN